MKSDQDIGAHQLSWRKRFLYSLIMLAIPLLTLEVGLRALFAYQEGFSVMLYGTQFYHKQMNEDPHVGTMNHHEAYWKYFPHQERFTRDRETGNRIPVTINSHGFRGKEYTLQKPPHTIRILTLGASSTFGFSNRDDETYPYYMEKMLNERCTRDSHFEVVNFGIPHLKSDQILALLLNEGLPLHPDVVTFYEGVNDCWDSPVRRKKLRTELTLFRDRARQISFLRRCYTTLRDHSVTILLADGLLRKRDMKFSHDDFVTHVEGKSHYFLKNLSEIANICRRDGILFIVASQQAKSFIVDRDDIRGVTYAQEGEIVQRKLDEQHHITDRELYFLTHMHLMQAEAEWARANNILSVDIISALDQRRDVLLSWVHLSRDGNRIVADALTQEILLHLCLNTGNGTKLQN